MVLRESDSAKSRNRSYFVALDVFRGDFMSNDNCARVSAEKVESLTFSALWRFTFKGLAKLGNFVGQLGKNANVAQMLPSLATVSADRFVRTFVAELFLHVQTFLGVICRSV